MLTCLFGFSSPGWCWLVHPHHRSQPSSRSSTKPSSVALPPAPPWRRRHRDRAGMQTRERGRPAQTNPKSPAGRPAARKTTDPHRICSTFMPPCWLVETCLIQIYEIRTFLLLSIKEPNFSNFSSSFLFHYFRVFISKDSDLKAAALGSEPYVYLFWDYHPHPCAVIYMLLDVGGSNYPWADCTFAVAWFSISVYDKDKLMIFLFSGFWEQGWGPPAPDLVCTYSACMKKKTKTNYISYRDIFKRDYILWDPHSILFICYTCTRECKNTLETTLHCASLMKT